MTDRSVVVATRGRPASLERTLSRIVASAAHAGGAEIVVVDNGPDPETRETVEQAARAENSGSVRLVVEPTPGKARALNTGVAAAHGVAVAFTDDDVDVPLSWVHDMTTPILERRCDAVAGRIALAPELERPWIDDQMRVALADNTRLRDEELGLLGASAAVRRDIALEIRFDERLGPGALGFGEDDWFTDQVRAAGYRICPAGGPPVIHRFDESRLTRAGMVEKSVVSGRSYACLTYLRGDYSVRDRAVRYLAARLRLKYHELRHGPCRNSAPFCPAALDLAARVGYLSLDPAKALR